MIKKFKYKIPENLLPLMKETIEDFNSDYVDGYVAEWAMYELKHCSLYMICELEFKDDKTEVWKSPVVVIGSNDISVMETYNEATGNVNGSILCEVLRKCDNIVIDSNN